MQVKIWESWGEDFFFFCYGVLLCFWIKFHTFDFIWTILLRDRYGLLSRTFWQISPSNYIWWMSCPDANTNLLIIKNCLFFWRQLCPTGVFHLTFRWSGLWLCGYTTDYSSIGPHPSSSLGDVSSESSVSLTCSLRSISSRLFPLYLEIFPLSAVISTMLTFAKIKALEAVCSISYAHQCFDQGDQLIGRYLTSLGLVFESMLLDVFLVWLRLNFVGFKLHNSVQT